MFETNDKKEADSSEPEPESAEPESDYREWIPRILGGVHHFSYVRFSPHSISLISVRSHRTIPFPRKVTTSPDMERRPRIWPPKA